MITPLTPHEVKDLERILHPVFGIRLRFLNRIRHKDFFTYVAITPYLQARFRPRMGKDTYYGIPPHCDICIAWLCWSIRLSIGYDVSRKHRWKRQIREVGSMIERECAQPVTNAFQ